MRTAIYFLPILLLALLITSCTGKPRGGSGDGNNKQAVELTFDSIVVQEKIKLLPDKSGSIPYATLDIKFVYPTDFGAKEQIQQLQSVFYEKIFGEGHADAASPQEAIERYADDYAKSYRKELAKSYLEQLPNLDLTDEGDRFFLSTFNYEQEIKNHIEFQNDLLLSFTIVSHEYQGGAHGKDTKRNVNINLATYNQLEARDLFVENYEVALAEIIKVKLLEIESKELQADGYTTLTIEELKDQFYDFDAIMPNNNILLTETGITVTYNPYEISGLGVEYFYNAEIAYGEIVNLLNPDMFAKLFPDIDLQKEKEAFQLQEEENSKTVADMFLLLPDEAFNGEYPLDVRKKMVENKDCYLDNNEYESIYFKYGGLRTVNPNELNIEDEADLPLGYVCFWQLPDNRRLVTVIYDGLPFKAYWYKNGKLEKDNEFYAFVNENIDYKWSDFLDIDFNKVPEDSFLRGSFNRVNVWYRCNISKDGDISFTADCDFKGDLEEVEEVYVILFERIGDKWTKKG